MGGKYFEASGFYMDKNAVINAGIANEPVSRLLQRLILT